MSHIKKYLASFTIFSAGLLASGSLLAAPKNLPSLEEAAKNLGKTGFQGLVFAARGDKVLLEKSFGAIKDSKQTFRFASITKQMTAILVMQEVEAGKLQLDQPLGAYWPDYPNVQARNATIRQLLTHYSGLYNEMVNPAVHMMDANSGDDIQKFATGLCAGPVTAAPGSKFDYNNCDYIVLGALLEKINKQSFLSLLQQRIFAPAGMSTASYYTAALPDSKQHIHGTLGGKPEPEVNLASYGPAGSSFGTLKDLYAFDLAFIQGKYLPAKSREVMVKPNNVGGALGVWSYPFRASDAHSQVMIIERQGWIAGVRILNLVDLQSQSILIMVSTNGDLDLSQTWANKGPAAEMLRALLGTQ
ncbi:serine hydrolase domain-containing protein [Undibacterium sp. TS12]|uniref:serine hydrolase domain-containing protein n=1 Tax=Undibacterium sp. TS12 TaxID=2908202 RepID=UPI001F4C66F4|nr:serine hydrolase domain-containing protein [Undibacterium sp. TS12]MCH8622376.1 beta-lactamase family protein [Undibacterium sp. TS12]